MRRFVDIMAGRIIERNSMADAKAKEAYIRHKNMLYGMALREKLNEEKANRREHQRADIIRVNKKGDEYND